MERNINNTEHQLQQKTMKIECKQWALTSTRNVINEQNVKVEDVEETN